MSSWQPVTFQMLTDCTVLLCFFRARVATKLASSLPTLCRGSGQERECGGLSRAFLATEREDTWPWRNPRYANIIVSFNDLFHFSSYSNLCLYPLKNYTDILNHLVCDHKVPSICGTHNIMCRVAGGWSPSQHTLGERQGTSWAGCDQRIGTKIISVSVCWHYKAHYFHFYRQTNGCLFLKITLKSKITPIFTHNVCPPHPSNVL